MTIRLQISHDSNPATATLLLRWLSTKDNLIDLAEKAFLASESRNTSKRTVNTQSELQICMKRIREGFEHSDRKD